MVSRRRTRALRQFLEFTTKDVMYFQLLGDFPCDIEVICSPGMPICLLKKDDVRTCSCKEFDNRIQFRTARYVPTHDPKCGRSLGQFGSERTRFNVAHDPTSRTPSVRHWRRCLVAVGDGVESL